MNIPLGGEKPSWDQLCVGIDHPYPCAFPLSRLVYGENNLPYLILAGMLAYLN
jgi:hypothetical protein